ncbi:MAG TPA: DegT/DnrJ/EryC1/StrS family aminotransferase [Syntrophales bacterium]|jgi:dTDP-4-amino-4,6-dideoxygalactose transaminase|nr:DegT/DnrJ/EryC1/StrS family aminotransferase [Syntrophales bacterium]
MSRKVKFVEPAKLYRMIKEELDAAYFEVMSKGDLIDRGQLRSFEEHLAAFVGTKYAVGLNSGYDALHMSLRAAGIGPGDEVIVPAHTFVATASAVVNVGARPVLVDVGKDFNIDGDRVEELLAEENRRGDSRIRAIIPVHLSGYMADMVRIMELAEKYRLVVIEDACQSLGAGMERRAAAVDPSSAEVNERFASEHGQTARRKTKKTKTQTADLFGIEENGSPTAFPSPAGADSGGAWARAGSWGLTGCWSFYPFKILGGYGDGGAITTNDPEVALFATRMRYNGEDRQTGEYHGHGFTCLLDNLQAAFLDVKLRYLPQWIIRRQGIAARYREALSDLPDLLLPHYEDPRRDHVYQNYTVRARQGNDFSEYLKANGIEVLTQFRKPYYRHEALKLEDRGFPETEALSREVCSLPMNVEIGDDEVDYVIEVVRSFYGKT